MIKTIFSLVFLALICAGVVAFIGSRALPGPLITPKIVWIPSGTGLAGIAERLHAAGAITYPSLFLAHAVTMVPRGSLKAGEYDLPARVPMGQILDMMRAGKVHLRKITIPEGLTSAQVVGMVRDNPYMGGPVPEAIPAEGTLWPETYAFVRGGRRAVLIARMQEDHARMTARMWEERPKDCPLTTFQDWITLASIVEKETGQAQERPQVAAVFLNRLKKGMKLQSDPTVIYAITNGVGTLDRPLLRADLDGVKSPYNTYLNIGLPPGPIANPGRDSLTAVLYPAATDDLYFVADGTGGHAFAKTLDDHNKNVAHWRALSAAAMP